jgi:hypothetical protein
MTLLIHLLALAASFGFVYLWYKTSPAKGSGWAMFAAVLLGLSSGSGETAQSIQVVTALAAAAGFGFTWYRTRDKEYSGWLLAVAILCALGAF